MMEKPHCNPSVGTSPGPQLHSQGLASHLTDDQILLSAPRGYLEGSLGPCVEALGGLLWHLE